MSTKSIRIAAVSGVLAVSAIAGYWYWSPHLAIHNMQAAAKAKDAEAFNDYVDYPKLRESFKGQISALMTDSLAEPKVSENPFAALGAMMAMGLVGTLVDAMVRPEAVMNAMQDGKFSQPGKQSSEAPSGTAQQGGSASEDGDKTQWDFQRLGANKLIAYAIDPKKPAEVTAERFGVVFLRSGFADWKLAEVRMPTMTK